MTKIHTTLTVDPDLFAEAKQTGMNMSLQFEEYLRLKLNQMKNNSAGISLLLKKKEFEKAEKESLKWDIVSKRLRDEIVLDERALQEKEVQRLENEKKTIEAQKCCVVCKGLILPESKFELAFLFEEKEYFVHTRCHLDWMESRIDNKLGISRDDLRDHFLGKKNKVEL